MAGTKPTQIIIVDELFHDKEHKFIATAAEIATRAGFSVRRKSEYIPCEKCHCAVPVKELWQFFVDKKFKVPSVWNSTCSNCSAKNL